MAKPAFSNQHDRFFETARALGAGEDPAAFRAALGSVGRLNPKGDAPKPPKGPNPKKDADNG